MALQFPDVDEDLVKRIVDKLKSQGIFDQFRKDCLADVDSRPACQNLKDKVNGAVADFLSKQPWKDDLNKNQVRESLRKHVQQQYLEVGVNKIVEQVVNPKIFSVFMPKVEDVVYQVMGIEKPANAEDRGHNRLRFLMSNSVSHTSPGNVFPEILPTDLEPVSPGSINESGNESANLNDSVTSKTNDDGDNISHDVNKESNMDANEASNDSKVSGISELSSHGSTTKLDISESAHLPGDKPEIHSDINSIPNPSDAGDGDKSKGGNEPPSGAYDFDNFSNLKEKLLKTDPLNKNLDKDKIESSNAVTKDNSENILLKDESLSTVIDSESRVDKTTKSPLSCLYSEDSVGSNCSQKNKLKTEKLHLFNESTRNSLVMDCEESSMSCDKKLGVKPSEFTSCVESSKDESQMSLASNDSRKFSNFASLNLINENSQNRSGASSPDTSKNASDHRKRDDERKRSSQSYRRSREGHDSRHRSRNSSRDRKYSKDSKSRYESESRKYSSSSRDKHSSRSKDDRHRSDSKTTKNTGNENSKREKDSKSTSSHDDRSSKRDKEKSRDDHKASRNRGKDSQNSSDDDKKMKRNETKTQEYKESKSNSDKNSKDKDSKSSSDNRSSAKKNLDDSKISKVRETDSKFTLDDRKSLKDKNSKTCEDDRYYKKDKEVKTPFDDGKSSKTKEDTKSSSASEKEVRSSSHDHKSSRSKDAKPTSEANKTLKKVETDENSKTSRSDHQDDDKSMKIKTDSTDKPSTDKKSDLSNKKKSGSEGNSKKDEKGSRKRKRENCSDESDKKDHRRSRDRDDGGHRSGGSSRDHKEPSDKKRKSNSSTQEKSAPSNSKESSSKEQEESNRSCSLSIETINCEDNFTVPPPLEKEANDNNIVDKTKDEDKSNFKRLEMDGSSHEVQSGTNTMYDSSENYNPTTVSNESNPSHSDHPKSDSFDANSPSLPDEALVDCVGTIPNHIGESKGIICEITSKHYIDSSANGDNDLKGATAAPDVVDSSDKEIDVRFNQDEVPFYGFDQLSMDKSFKWVINFENFLKRTYASDSSLDIEISSKCFSFTDNNLNSLPFKNGLPSSINDPNSLCSVVSPSTAFETLKNPCVLSPVTKSSMNFLNEKADVPEESILPLAESSCDESILDLTARSCRKTTDDLDEKTTEICKNLKEGGFTKTNEDVLSLSESCSSDRGFTLPSVTEDMLDNFMMENIADKLDSCYASSDSDVEELTVPVVPDAVILNDSYEESSTLRGVPQIEGVSIPSGIGSDIKLESRVSQRFKDVELYKPRPLISNPSRRNRVANKNGSKPTRGTKRTGDSMEFSENKRPR